MAGFTKAKAEQAALKIGGYGPAGSGKTFTAMLVAEGLAKHAGKRVAVVDTEHGTDFYVKDVPARSVHPKAFDVDALYTRSLADVLSAVRSLTPATHSVVIIDSITHLWEAAVAAYRGPKNRAGQIPMHAWGAIKKPYKDLMHWLINSELHVIILGRQGNEWGEDTNTGEVVNTGFKMKAEGETAYEPHVLLRFECNRPRDGKKVLQHATAITSVFVEKDRSGVLAGRMIDWPNFDNIAAPLLGLLGGKQAQLQSDDDAAERDHAAFGSAMAEQSTPKKPDEQTQKSTVARFVQRYAQAGNLETCNRIGSDVKEAADRGDLTNGFLAAVRIAHFCRSFDVAATGDEYERVMRGLNAAVSKKLLDYAACEDAKLAASAALQRIKGRRSEPAQREPGEDEPAYAGDPGVEGYELPY